MPPQKTKLGKTGLQWLHEHVIYNGDDCLIWPLSGNQQGYGQVSLGRGVFKKAHRLMCELAHGEPPTAKHQASHSCGNGHMGCVNPRHLAWKTNGENQLERWRVHGRRTGNPGGQKGKLTLEQVRTIQAERGKTSVWKLAQRFGVVHGTISYWHRKIADSANQ